MILFLYACGGEVALDQPSPPPTPPPLYTAEDADVVTLVGLVSDVHPPTRSWVVLGESKRQICHLAAEGVLEIAGRPSQVVDLAAGLTMSLEGKRHGDLVVVTRAVVETEAAPSPEIPAARETPATP